MTHKFGPTYLVRIFRSIPNLTERFNWNFTRATITRKIPNLTRTITKENNYFQFNSCFFDESIPVIMRIFIQFMTFSMCKRSFYIDDSSIKMGNKNPHTFN